jgi:hypothetical protein
VTFSIYNEEEMPVMDPSFVDNVTVLKLYTELKITEWNNNIAVLVLISVKPGKNILYQ